MSELIISSIPKPLTVYILKDKGKQEADADIKTMLKGDGNLVKFGISELYLHHLRLRVAQDESLFDKIAAFYVDENNNQQCISLALDGPLHWPVNFGSEIWDTEMEIEKIKRPKMFSYNSSK